MSFALLKGSDVSIELYDTMGRMVSSRRLGHQLPGRRTVVLPESAALAPGVYMIRLTLGGKSVTRRGVLLK